VKAGGEDLVEVGFGDAGDGDGGEGDGLGDLAGVVGAGENVAGLGGGGEDGTDADVISAVEEGLAGLFDAMGADAEEFVGAEEFADVGGGEVGLADVNAVGVGEEGDVGAVVDDAEDVVLAAEGDELVGAAEEVAGLQVFFTELEAVGAAEDGLFGGLEPGAFAEGFGDQDVEADVFEAVGGVKGAGELLFEGVEAVAEGFDGSGGGGGFGLEAFLNDAEGFAEAFAGGGDEGGEVFAAEFVGGFVVGANVAGGVAMEDGSGEEGADGGGEVVAEVFQGGRELVVVEDEAGVVFQHAQGFSGAIGVDVEDS
jgi:hypothetical protein